MKKKALSIIEDAGFGFTKFEFEAQMYRMGTPRRCEECTDGYRQCETCHGDGTVIDPQNNIFTVETLIDCSRCEGDGGDRCGECNGRGRMGDWSDETACHVWMLDWVLKKKYNTTYKEMREANPIPDGVRMNHDQRTFYGMPDLVFGRFYNDHSVDSEYTCTFPTSKAIELGKLYAQAFVELSKIAGGGHVMVTTGAGMHISVLPTQNNGVYPGQWRMPENQVNNFIREVSKLLPALYFVGTAGHRSREFRYRVPQISTHDKYSAIFTHGNTCFEYRVFETCYDRLEAIGDFLSVIAQSLKFYANPDLKVKQLDKQFGFSNTSNVADYYNTPEQLRILNATVKYLKPEDKTYKQLKNERGLKYTISSLKQKQRIRLSELRSEYDRYAKRYQETRQRPLDRYELAELDNLMLNDGMTHTEAEAYVRSSRQGSLTDFANFVRNNLERRRTSHTVTV